MVKKIYFHQKIIGILGLLFIAALCAGAIYNSYLVKRLLAHDYDSRLNNILSTSNNTIITRQLWQRAAIDGAVSTFSVVVTGAIGIYYIVCTAAILAHMGLQGVARIQASLTACVIAGICLTALEFASATLLSYRSQGGWSYTSGSGPASKR
ncbi:hypothetical protein V1523DRAFT_271592 [Lipomyces doorenjongii]